MQAASRISEAGGASLRSHGSVFHHKDIPMIKPGAFHPTGWLRLLALVAIVLSGAVTLPANDSSAAPMSAATIGATQPQVLQVRDGCGRASFQ